MKVTRVNPLTNTMNSMELAITDEQLASWQEGTLIQDAMPHLTADEREFLISGLMPGDWEKVFGEEQPEANGNEARLDIEAFRKTRRQPTDAEWADISETLGPSGPARETCFLYIDNYLLHEADGLFWPHAWWYAPVGMDRREDAEAALFEWQKEWL